MPSENTLFPLPDTLLRPMVEQALSEDLGRRGDITSAAVIAPDKTAKLFLVSRENGVIAGMDLARLAFQTMDPCVRFQAEIRDGQAVHAGQMLAAVEGNARALLAAERTALNYLTHLSGIATATARAVAEVAEYGTDIVCSRKTIPLLRILQNTPSGRAAAQTTAWVWTTPCSSKTTTSPIAAASPKPCSRQNRLSDR